MELQGKHVVVTGGASGIGAALCERFAAEGARAVVVADRDADGAAAVAARLDGRGLPASTDVGVEADVQELVERATDAFGPVDLFCSNAGILVNGGAEAIDEDWQRIWQINFMAHVYAARAVLPDMLARGDGYLLQTVSAAGLLTSLAAAPYAVTKHAALAFAEWLSITHGDDGLKVSCLCPQGVRTALLAEVTADPDDIGGRAVLAAGEVFEPSRVAEIVVAGLRDERFLILPHPEVHDYAVRRASDPDAWLSGMRRMQARLRPG